MTADIIPSLDRLLQSRKGAAASTSYSASLYARGDDTILKKIAEESAEVLMAAKDLRHGQGSADNLVKECADLWFHCLVALAHFNLSGEAVLAELARREGTSGLVEKAARSSS